MYYLCIRLQINISVLFCSVLFCSVLFCSNPPSRFYLTFSIISLLLDVIVLTMKTKFTIPILQRAVRLKKKKNTNHKKEKSNTFVLGPSRRVVSYARAHFEKFY